MVIKVLKTMIFMRSSLITRTTTLFVHTSTSGNQTIWQHKEQHLYKSQGFLKIVCKQLKRTSSLFIFIAFLVLMIWDYNNVLKPSYFYLEVQITETKFKSGESGQLQSYLMLWCGVSWRLLGVVCDSQSNCTMASHWLPLLWSPQRCGHDASSL